MDQHWDTAKHQTMICFFHETLHDVAYIINHSHDIFYFNNFYHTVDGRNPAPRWMSETL